LGSVSVATECSALRPPRASCPSAAAGWGGGGGGSMIGVGGGGLCFALELSSHTACPTYSPFGAGGGGGGATRLSHAPLLAPACTEGGSELGSRGRGRSVDGSLSVAAPPPSNDPFSWCFARSASFAASCPSLKTSRSSFASNSLRCSFTCARRSSSNPSTISSERWTALMVVRRTVAQKMCTKTRVGLPLQLLIAACI
jgi:hypothetical protein